MYQEERTRILRRCFFDVQNEIGLGRQEQAYQRGCELWLKENGIPFRSKVPHPIRLGEAVAHTLWPDLVVWDEITVELKAVKRRLQDGEFVQLVDYLKCRGDGLGLLANFGLERVEVHRFLYDKPASALREDWQYWSQRIQDEARRVGAAVRDGLRFIYETHGTGYGEQVSEDLITTELSRRRLAFAKAPSAKARFRNVEVDESPLECFVIEYCIVLTFSALFDDNRINIGRGKSYLSALGLEWGIGANFGKKELQLSGLHVNQ